MSLGEGNPRFPTLIYNIIIHSFFIHGIRCNKDEGDQIDYHEFALHLTRQQPPAAAAASDHLTSVTMKDFKPPQQQK